MKTFRKNGDVERMVQTTTWTPQQGLPFCEGKQIISQMGWACKRVLEQNGIGKKGTDIPQMWLCDQEENFQPISQQYAIPQSAVKQLIRIGDISVGYLFEDNDAEYAYLTGILPKDQTIAPEKQTLSVFERMEQALQQVGMEFSNVARTWLYMDRILDWYDPFNKARDAFFTSRKVYDGLVPASTGIGSANLCGSAITAGTLAVKAKHPGAVKLQIVDSPLQCTAHAYGSSFSRAMELDTKGFRYLTISGTASIEPGGKTAYVGDIDKQLGLTLDVVEAILKSRNLAWNQTARAIMYLKHTEFLPHWEKIRKARGLDNLPIATIHADVCRDDLLCELELDAVENL